MARQGELLPFAREVIEVPVADEMSESFLAYSLSVITARAIPDVRDGLKPVQRRILYSMLNMGIRPDGPHRKCARVVGDTMGNFHPHGDTAIYETLVRMGQDFARNVTLIDPQGNFGSLDEPAAAHRYTECRLSQAAMEMLGELDEDTVAFRTTYDGESQEPEYLPGKVPNLLVNGTTGIAVGMATNMAPHNLGEVAEAIKIVLTKRRPKPTVDELMAVLPGPDFPSGGIAIDEDLREIYETGRGTVRVRARTEIVKLTAKRQGIIVTELPYMIGPEKVMSKIKSLMKNDKLAGVAGIVNLSDRHHGLRIQIDCEIGANPQAVLANLYRLTQLEDSFAFNNVVLVNGTPTTVSLYDLCSHYIEHRLDIIRRRTEYRLQKARDRLHIVDGLLTALDNIDLVIAIIRGSETVAEAREALCEQLTLSEIQATHILDMQFRRLVGMEKQKLIDEQAQLRSSIDDFEKLLKSDKRQRTIVQTELDEIVAEFGRDRRTEIIGANDVPVFKPSEVAAPVDLPDEPALVTLTTSGQVGRAPADGAKKASPGRHDVLVSAALTNTAEQVLAITTEGRILAASVHEIGDAEGRARGAAASQAFGTNRGERLLALVGQSDEPIVLVTARGTAKRVTAEEARGTKHANPIIKLKDGDRLAAAFPCPEGADIIMVANDAQALRTSVDAISVQGRNAGGVAGMKLKGDAQVIAAGAVLADVWDGAVVTVTDASTAKATPFDEVPGKGRGTGGVRLTKFGKESELTSAYVGAIEGLLVIMSTDDDTSKADPIPVAFPLEPTRRDLASTATDRPILALGPARW